MVEEEGEWWYLNSSGRKRTIVLQEFLDVFWVGDLEHCYADYGCHFRVSCCLVACG